MHPLRAILFFHPKYGVVSISESTCNAMSVSFIHQLAPSCSKTISETQKVINHLTFQEIPNMNKDIRYGIAEQKHFN